MERLAKSDILRALEQLASALPQSDRPRELWLVGGAAIVLLYGSRETTKDVDAFMVDPSEAAVLRIAARAVAGTLALPEDWLNDGAKGYLKGLAPGPVLLSTSELIIRAVAPHQLLAMKLSAWRDDVDIADARLLLAHLPGGRELVWKLVESHLIPGRELKAQHAFEDLWEADRGSA